MNCVFTSIILCVLTLGFAPLSARAVSEADLPGHSLYLHIKGWAAPFPGPGDYTIDFAAAGHSYSIKQTGAVPAAGGGWTFRQGEIGGSVVITLENYFGDGTPADIVLLPTGYYELYAFQSNQNGNWSLQRFVKDPIFAEELADLTAPEKGYVNFVPSLLNGTVGVSFQWFKDGLPLAGANKSSLLLLPLDKSMEGLYSVQVSQGSDTNLSRSARLTIVPAQPAVFNGQTFEVILTNNTPPPGLPATDAANAFRLKGFTQAAWKNGELTFLADYAGAGTNRNNGGVGLFAVSNGVPRKLLLNTETMAGTDARYTSIGGFSEPEHGVFLFNAVAKSPSGGLEYGVMKWNGSSAVRLLASKSPIPGNESLQFQFFGLPGGVGSDAAFGGFGPGTASGYYEFQGEKLTRLVDNDSTLLNFPTSPLSIDGSVIPAGTSESRVITVRQRSSGIYGAYLRKADGTFQPLINSNTAYPGSTNLMTQIGGAPPRSLNDVTAFLLNDQLGNNFLVSIDAQGLHAIARTGDAPAGRSATIVNINRFGLTDRGIVFEATLTGGRTGVYLQQGNQITTVVDTLSSIGTNVVTGVGLQAASSTNLVVSASLYPSGTAGTFVNSGAAPVLPLRLNGVTSRFNPDGHFSIGVVSEAGRTVVVEHSSDLANWEPITTNTLTTAETSIVDPQSSPEHTRRFYRAKHKQP